MDAWSEEEKFVCCGQHAVIRCWRKGVGISVFWRSKFLHASLAEGVFILEWRIFRPGRIKTQDYVTANKTIAPNRDTLWPARPILTHVPCRELLKSIGFDWLLWHCWQKHRLYCCSFGKTCIIVVDLWVLVGTAWGAIEDFATSSLHLVHFLSSSGFNSGCPQMTSLPTLWCCLRFAFVACLSFFIPRLFNAGQC